MSLVRSARRLAQLDLKDQLLLGETVVELTFASLAIRLFPFRAVVRRLIGSRTDQEVALEPRLGEVSRILWAVEACATRLPWKIVCFQKGLALHRLLAKRRIVSSLHYGVAQNPKLGLTAHVWVTAGGQPIIGGDVAVNYTCLATFPAAPSPPQ